MKPVADKSKGSILVIEDDPKWQKIVERLCEGEGFSVRRANNLAKAVSLLNREEFDAIVSDVRLKDWEETNREGLDALKTLPQQSRPSVIVITAYPDFDNTRVAFSEFKVVDVQSKLAFEDKDFLAKLRQAVKATRENRRKLVE